jgi:hypothetical protein
MIRILVDHNIEGQALLMWRSLISEGWPVLLQMKVVLFTQAGLLYRTNDRQVWRFAQENGMILLTANLYSINVATNLSTPEFGIGGHIQQEVFTKKGARRHCRAPQPKGGNHERRCQATFRPRLLRESPSCYLNRCETPNPSPPSHQVNLTSTLTLGSHRPQ